MADKNTSGNLSNFSVQLKNSESILSTERRYKGMINDGPVKSARNRLVELTSYMDSVVSNFYAMHTFVSIWRIVQLWGAMMVSQCKTFWEEDSMAKHAVNYLTVLCFIIPGQYRMACSVVVELICAILTLIFSGIMLWAGYEYRKTSKLPDMMPTGLTIYMASLFYIVPGIALENGFGSLGAVIAGEDMNWDKVLSVVCAVFVGIVYIVTVWFVANVASIALVFRPTSLLTVCPLPSVFIFLFSNVVVGLVAFASHLPTWPKVIVTFLAAATYAVVAYVPFMPGSFVSQTHSRFVFATGVTGCLFLILVAVYHIIEKRASETEFFIMIGIFIVALIVSMYLFNMRVKRHMMFLDSAMDDASMLDLIESPSQLISYTCTGMEYAHPLCLNWALLKAGTERWPDNVLVWFIFGKFVAIYPEEDTMLGYVVQNVISKKLTGSVAKATVQQASTVMRTRETALNPGLKRKINHVQKRVAMTKRKLRQIWDLVIQGNVNEMQGAINMAYASVERSQNDFNHLTAEYPNNKYVTRSYCRFVQEILADKKQFDEWHEKLRLMQRGMRVNADRANVIGLHAYSRLPQKISNPETKGMQAMDNDGLSSSEMLDMEDEQPMVEEEQITVVREKIANVTVPSRSCIVKTNILLIILMVFVPGVVAMIMVPHFVDSLTDPLQFMYYMSLLRSLGFQAACFSHRYVLECLPANTTADRSTAEKVFVLPKIVPELEAWGYANETKPQLLYILSQVTSTLEGLSQYNHYGVDRPELERAREIAFGKKLNYSYYYNRSTSESRLITLQDGCADFSLMIARMVAGEITDDTMDDPGLLNGIRNVNGLADELTEALLSLNEHIVAIANNSRRLAIVLLVVGLLVFAVTWITTTILEVRMMMSDNREVYRCLTALPKNVVSALSESLRVLQKQGDETSRTSEGDTELNRQEENVMKILANAADSSVMETDKVIFIASLLLTMVAAMVSGILAVLAVLQIQDDLKANSSHVDYVLGVSAYLCGSILAINEGIGKDNGLDLYISREHIQDLTHSRVEVVLDYYHLSRFGGPLASQRPCPSIEHALAVAEAEVKEFCPDRTAIPDDYLAIYECYNPDIQLLLVAPFLYEIYSRLFEVNETDENGNAVSAVKSRGPGVNGLWDLGALKVYGMYLYPMFQDLLPDLYEIMSAELPRPRIGIIIVMIASVVLYILGVIQTDVNKNKLLFALGLLNHCPPHVVLQTPKIMDVLGGDFSDQSKDKTQRDTEFFDHVVESLPDAVVIANTEKVVTLANKATNTVLHIPPENVMNTDIRTFLSPASGFKEDLAHMLDSEKSCIKAEYKDPVSGQTVFFDVNSFLYNETYAVTFRDITQSVLYNTLIEEEKAKSDRLLASILPESLVPRVQRGEKNISFAVQSVTVVFMDIVEFTPWCGKNTAATVVKILNAMYSKFDSLVNATTTMTRIKCIGDCYMAAGGIFSEVNQPAVHAREVVQFGLDCIQSMLDLNATYDQDRRIRVGVNTGGPIVAGVLGTDKPTFEILGPAINMAQQMEHHGVPMKVHISRPVYELVYGSQFIIKERGQTEVKNGSVLTYLVEGVRQE